MRVIAGTARGAPLESPKDRTIRPTLDRVREALFSILGPQLADVAFLDLFAGTGANGIEALSRGAQRCLFVDSSAASLALVRRNLESARLLDNAAFERLNLPSQLERLTSPGAPYGVIFADPPHIFTEYDLLVKTIGRDHLLAEEGVLVIEHSAETNLKEENGPLHRFRQADYGKTTLSFFEHTSSEEAL